MDIAKMVIKNLTKLIISILVIILIVFIGLKIYGAITDKNPPIDEEPPVSEEGIEVSTIKAYLAKNDSKPVNTGKTITKTGTILAGQEVSISPEISANIVELYVKEGTLVKKGQVIAKLENSTQLSTAIVNYNSAIQSLNNAQQLLNITVQSGEVSMSTFAEQFASAQLNVQKAALQLESGRTIRYNQMELEDINSATTDLERQLQERIQSQTTTDTASMNGAADSDEQNYYNEYLQDAIKDNKQVSQVKARENTEIQGVLQDQGNILGIESAQIQLSLLAKQMQSTGLQNRASVINSQNQINQIRQQLETAKISLALGEVKSPINGVVTNVKVTKGSKVNPGQEMLLVSNFDTLNVKLFLSPAEVLMAASGVQKVEVEVLGSKVPAQINYFGVVANPQTRTIPVEVSPQISNSTDRAKFIPNTFAKVMFMTKNQTQTPEEPVTEVAGIPISALRKENEQFKVAVIENGLVAFKSVVLAPGIKAGKAQLASGITDGTDIIVAPADLIAGTKVKQK